ncbi:MAG: chemotaxis protein CheC [Desulfobacterales bacterium]|nr:chemotaxis protein CheC [Desulfobacterales bacterium]
MKTETNDVFSEEEEFILQEIMSIAFGRATANLTEIIDIYVELSSPEIETLEVAKAPAYIKNTMDAFPDANIVVQKFWGDLSGSGLLIFPVSEAKKLISLLTHVESDYFPDMSLASLDKELFLEIGNILIGACVGKIVELLGTFATYSPPGVANHGDDFCRRVFNHLDPDDAAIAMKTTFRFDRADLHGSLLLLTDSESIPWLRKALHAFMENYE